MSTALTTNGLWCHTSASAAMTTNGLWCQGIIDVLAGLVKLTAEVAQTSVCAALAIGDATVELVKALARASGVGTVECIEISAGSASVGIGEGAASAAASQVYRSTDLSVGDADRSAGARGGACAEADKRLEDTDVAIAKTVALVEDFC